MKMKQPFASIFGLAALALLAAGVFLLPRAAESNSSQPTNVMKSILVQDKR